MYNTYDVINLFQASAVKRPDIHPYSIKLMDMIKYHRIFQWGVLYNHTILVLANLDWAKVFQ